ncbi:MAG TPA: A/G-specific adenine glycosylase [Longimicrobiales bacterium]|nr:A/G-specific adenine glycosylase [Longimicrobiales bacterium]
MTFADALLHHFDRTRRDMPWRRTSDPYAIWVSEVMLQQTRVEAVIPYWERWMARYPSVEELAEADLDDVLRHWQGLGYYTRARNLHRAAREVRERHAGRVPGDRDELRRLPGVGEYTAGAVASIAFGRRVPAVDGNVRRVLSRLYDLEHPRAAELRRLADALVPAGRPGDFNQALMELGATLCTPRSPRCGDCPVSAWCRARALGVQDERPRRRPPRRVPEEAVETDVVVRGDGALLLVRRPDRGLLAGLWEPPGDHRPSGVQALIEAADPGPALEPVVHTFTHKRVTYHPRLHHAVGPGPDGLDGPDVTAWVARDRLGEYAMSVAQQKIVRAALRALGEGAGRAERRAEHTNRATAGGRGRAGPARLS